MTTRPDIMHGIASTIRRAGFDREAEILDDIAQELAALDH